VLEKFSRIMHRLEIEIALKTALGLGL
jgi:hypothetical protein